MAHEMVQLIKQNSKVPVPSKPLETGYISSNVIALQLERFLMVKYVPFPEHVVQAMQTESPSLPSLTSHATY